VRSWDDNLGLGGRGRRQRLHKLQAEEEGVCSLRELLIYILFCVIESELESLRMWKIIL
jgi:hypothetical protein